jgi:hypothetical protein
MLGNTDVIVTRVQRWPRLATVLGPFVLDVWTLKQKQK